MIKIRIGIYGYGNIGKGVELAVLNSNNLELVGIFSRRENIKTLNSMTIQASRIKEYKKNRCFNSLWGSKKIYLFFHQSY